MPAATRSSSSWMVGSSCSMKEANSEAPILSPAETTRVLAGSFKASCSNVAAQRSVMPLRYSTPSVVVVASSIRPWKSLKVSRWTVWLALSSAAGLALSAAAAGSAAWAGLARLKLAQVAKTKAVRTGKRRDMAFSL